MLQKLVKLIAELHVNTSIYKVRGVFYAFNFCFMVDGRTCLKSHLRKANGIKINKMTENREKNIISQCDHAE